jgi:hypothetical protein
MEAPGLPRVVYVVVKARQAARPVASRTTRAVISCHSRPRAACGVTDGLTARPRAVTTGVRSTYKTLATNVPNEVYFKLRDFGLARERATGRHVTRGGLTLPPEARFSCVPSRSFRPPLAR